MKAKILRDIDIMEKQNKFVLSTRKNNRYMAIHLVMNELKIMNMKIFIGNA